MANEAADAANDKADDPTISRSWWADEAKAIEFDESDEYDDANEINEANEVDEANDAVEANEADVPISEWGRQADEVFDGAIVEAADAVDTAEADETNVAIVTNETEADEANETN